MQFSPKISSVIAASILLFSGCTQMDKRLVINASVDKRKMPKPLKYNKVVKLDNYTRSKGIITLKNAGDKPLKLIDISLKDSTNLFEMTNKCPKILAPHKRCKLDVAFKGERKGIYHAKVVIISNDPRQKKARVALIANAFDKYHGKVVKTSSSTIKTQQAIKLDFNTLNTKQYVQIRNTGLADLQLQSPRLIGPDKQSFSYSIKCPKTLKVGDSCEVTVKYNPKVKEGHSDALLLIPTNGTLSPSETIRLSGFSKPYSISITNFVVSKNIKNFLDDYFATKKVYYVRTIYQKNVDRLLDKGIQSKIEQTLKSNGYTLTSTPSKADKIITLYPSISVSKNEKTNDVNYDVVFNGFVLSKSNNTKIKQYNKNKLVGYNVDTNSSKFSVLDLNSQLLDKEEFEFGINIEVNNASNDIGVSDSVSNIIVSKLFNVLGFLNSKGQ